MHDFVQSNYQPFPKCRWEVLYKFGNSDWNLGQDRVLSPCVRMPEDDG